MGFALVMSSRAGSLGSAAVPPLGQKNALQLHILPRSQIETIEFEFKTEIFISEVVSIPYSGKASTIPK
jgi:hypothetical protein